MNSTNVVTESTPNSTQSHQRNHPEQCLILSENSFERKQNYIRKLLQTVLNVTEEFTLR